MLGAKREWVDDWVKLLMETQRSTASDKPNIQVTGMSAECYQTMEDATALSFNLDLRGIRVTYGEDVDVLATVYSTAQAFLNSYGNDAFFELTIYAQTASTSPVAAEGTRSCDNVITIHQKHTSNCSLISVLQMLVVFGSADKASCVGSGNVSGKCCMFIQNGADQYRPDAVLRQNRPCSPQGEPS